MSTLKFLLLEYLFSPRSNCMGCGSVLGADNDYLCAKCYASVNPLFASDSSQGGICPYCGEEYVAGTCSVCRRRKFTPIRAAAAYEYEGAVKGLVRSFKFGGVWRMSDWMAGEMLKACGGDFLDGIDYTIPVPMHRLRRLRRGYNQSEKLALAFSKLSQIPYLNALKRTRNTKQQAKLNGQARRQNLNGAFECLENLSGKCVLLIDDVRTTGTTAVQCAKALYSAGAKEVRILTFAKAVPHRNEFKKYHPDKNLKLQKYEGEGF